MTGTRPGLVQRITLFPTEILVRRSPARAVIDRDVDRWMIDPMAPVLKTSREKLHWLMHAPNCEEFRNLLYWRLGRPSSALDRWLLALTKTIFRPLEALLISGSSIGPGLVIKHGYGTVIEAERIGENCLIFQDVVIGCDKRGDGRPTIGDHVHISAGAKVLGCVTIGDRAVIGANSVVSCDVPPGSLAVGIPARIVPGILLGQRRSAWAAPQDS